mmetsp:Transcript_9030/g.20195  ORF Transcript_9030/g.20195 Transcript_9030/m.20195 type:complete len:269 (-) Transcript_9030:589-1395(-)
MPRTAEQQRARPATLGDSATTTMQQMATGAMPGFKGRGIMEGSFRDEDGVDRVKDPPPEVKPILLALKEKAHAEGVNLVSEFQSNGGNPMGTITKGGFQGTLVRTFKRLHFDDELLTLLSDAYGTGLPDTKFSGCVEVAWKDFCEDVSKAEGSGATTAGSLSLGGAFGGKSRDADGTMDRVADPPEMLKKWLLTIKLKAASLSIDLIFSLRAQGGKPNGTMKKAQFLIALRTIFKEFTFTDQLLYSLSAAYGVGDPDMMQGNKTHIAW